VRGAYGSPGLAEARLRHPLLPRPGVPEPERRKEIEPGGFWPTVVDGDADEDVVRTLLCVLEEDVEVPVFVEDPGVEQLVLELLPRPASVRFHEVRVRELPLRVLVEVLHVRVRRRRVEVEVVLLEVLAVVPLAVGEAERALLEDGILAVPQRQREAEALLVVGEPAEAVFSPPVGPRPGMVVREVVPGVAALAVVLADGAPLPLAQVGPPLLPGGARLTGVVQPLLLRHVDEAELGGSRLFLRIGRNTDQSTSGHLLHEQAGVSVVVSTKFRGYRCRAFARNCRAAQPQVHWKDGLRSGLGQSPLLSSTSTLPIGNSTTRARRPSSPGARHGRSPMSRVGGLDASPLALPPTCGPSAHRTGRLPRARRCPKLTPDNGMAPKPGTTGPGHRSCQ
jgi:hypothetical protein